MLLYSRKSGLLKSCLAEIFCLFFTNLFLWSISNSEDKEGCLLKARLTMVDIPSGGLAGWMGSVGLWVALQCGQVGV